MLYQLKFYCLMLAIRSTDSDWCDVQFEAPADPAVRGRLRGGLVHRSRPARARDAIRAVHADQGSGDGAWSAAVRPTADGRGADGSRPAPVRARDSHSARGW